MTTRRSIRALSVRQPWAWLIVHNIKDIENRSWSTDYRGRFLVHAGKTFDEIGYNRVRDSFGIELPQPNELERGGIVGVVELIDIVTEHPSPWFEGPFGFVLTNGRPTTLFPVRGRLGFFEVFIEDERILSQFES